MYTKNKSYFDYYKATLKLMSFPAKNRRFEAKKLKCVAIFLEALDF